ncbi:6075_t:CDS:2 [Funneliformis caledonium]|uniref:6075_t:CDS:1 n=1 Tax=Funneliformis caledonium TaxID=1117310 RepID=A0A9N9F9Y7_9GLOM|nr:6075_t:CDS:2 [Funneliformis caledonium]
MRKTNFGSASRATVQRQEVQDQVVNKDQRHGDDHKTKNIADQQRKDIQAQITAQPLGQTNIPGQPNQKFPVQIPANMNSMQFCQQFGVPSTNQALDASAFAALQAQAIAQQDISQITSTQQPLQMPTNFIGVASQQVHQPAAPDFSAQVPMPTVNPVTTLSNDVLQANMIAAGGGSVLLTLLVEIQNQEALY